SAHANAAPEAGETSQTQSTAQNRTVQTLEQTAKGSADASVIDKNGETAKYRISLSGLNAQISKSDISFSGIFADSTIKSVENDAESCSAIVTITKKYSYDENRVGQIIVNGESYNITDDFFYAPALAKKGVRGSGPDPQTIIKATADLFKAWTDKSLNSQGSTNFFTGVGAINGVFVTANVAFTVLSMFQEKEQDPVLKALNEIQRKLEGMSTAIDFTSSEIQNSIKREAYAGYLNQYFSKYSAMRNSWIDIQISKFHNKMKTIANKAGVSGSNPDYTNQTVINKIYDYAKSSTNGYADILSLGDSLKELYSNNGSKTTGGLYTDFMNLMDITDGSSIPFSGDYVKADIHTIYRSFQSVAKNWTHETLADRREFTNTTVREALEIAAPLMFAINWDIKSSEAKIVQYQADLDSIYKADPACKTSFCSDPNNTNAVVLLRGSISDAQGAIQLSENLSNNVNNKLKAASAVREKEKTKIDNEQKQFNDKKVHNYRINQNFKKEITHYVDEVEGKGFWDMNKNQNPEDYETKNFHLPSNTWTLSEYRTMRYAAQIRNNNDYNALAYEMAGFAEKKVQPGCVWSPESSKAYSGKKDTKWHHFWLRNEVVWYTANNSYKEPVSVKERDAVWGDAKYFWGMFVEMTWWAQGWFPSVFEKA
ncbi:MAG: hypothetical protein LBB07_00615, partial [Bifidobacteriaceae bacterium]|nr:hypothetical protein [Bifidobacteriaceae bacterium]